MITRKEVIASWVWQAAQPATRSQRIIMEDSGSGVLSGFTTR